MMNEQFSVLEYFENGIRHDMVRAGLDPEGTVGMAQVHLMVERIQYLQEVLKRLALQYSVIVRSLGQVAPTQLRFKAAMKEVNDYEEARKSVKTSTT